MSQWRTTPDLEALNANLRKTIGEVLDIRFEAVDDDSLTASMVVDARTHQPYGLLHGGASVVLAETVGSTASYLCIDTSKYYCVGLEVNANHLRGLRSGRGQQHKCCGGGSGRGHPEDAGWCHGRPSHADETPLVASTGLILTYGAGRPKPSRSEQSGDERRCLVG